MNTAEERKAWRPKDWEKTRLNTAPGMLSRELFAFEAGADAMLKALFKLAEESPTGTFVIDSKKVNVF